MPRPKPKFYCWYEYDWGAPVSKKIKSDQLNYATGHQHGVRPTDKQWESRLPSLYANVRAAGAAKRPPVAYPGDSTVFAGKREETKSAH